MGDKDRQTSEGRQAAERQGVLGLASALALLVDRLEAHGALPPGEFQMFLRQTLTHSEVDADAPDAVVLRTILELLDAAPERLPLTLIKGGRDDV